MRLDLIAFFLTLLVVFYSDLYLIRKSKRDQKRIQELERLLSISESKLDAVKKYYDLDDVKINQIKWDNAGYQGVVFLSKDSYKLNLKNDW